jgi:hypothetical protein
MEVLKCMTCHWKIVFENKEGIKSVKKLNSMYEEKE